MLEPRERKELEMLEGRLWRARCQRMLERDGYGMMPAYSAEIDARFEVHANTEARQMIETRLVHQALLFINTYNI